MVHALYLRSVYASVLSSVTNKDPQGPSDVWFLHLIPTQHSPWPVFVSQEHSLRVIDKSQTFHRSASRETVHLDQFGAVIFHICIWVCTEWFMNHSFSLTLDDWPWWPGTYRRAVDDVRINISEMCHNSIRVPECAVCVRPCCLRPRQGTSRGDSIQSVLFLFSYCFLYKDS